MPAAKKKTSSKKTTKQSLKAKQKFNSPILVAVLILLVAVGVFLVFRSFAADGTITASGTKPTSYVVIGSGDIGKGGAGGKSTGDYIKNMNPAPAGVFTTGDNAYSDGTSSDYANNYNPYWGPFKNITFPSPGNHDYHTSGASGYYSYFNATSTSITGHTVDGRPDKGYYAWNLGPKWRFYSLNSEANVTEANNWLTLDLLRFGQKKLDGTDNPDYRPCVVAYWHSPPYTSGTQHGPSSTMQSTYFKTLYNNKADIVLTGHNHQYERFYPMDASGNRNDTRGIPSFVIGSGGDLPGYAFTSPLKPNSATHATNILGDLKLTVNDDATYSWEFIKTGGTTNFTDKGSGSCVQ